ncbi:MAG: D-alanine--D-alanine ligase family protein [Acidimicrobiales bacterium]
MPDVAVIFGGPSPEHDVSVLTGLQAARGLVASGGDAVKALYWSKTGDWFSVDPGLEAESFVGGVPPGAVRVQFVVAPGGGFSEAAGRLGRTREVGFDVAVVCCHGGPGEDGTLQAALDLAGISYTGPSVAGASAGMDKLGFGALVANAGLPALPRTLLTADGVPPSFGGPYIVKPRFGGSSIGIDVVTDLATARARLRANPHLRSGAVIEPYRSDLLDLQVAVRSWPTLQLSAIERPVRTSESADILDYRDKYVAGEGMAGAPRELPARIAPALEDALRGAAVQVAALAGLRGIARIDFLSDGTELMVNEINTIPGSLARYLWVEPQVAFGELLTDLVAEARERPTHAYTVAGADGTVLRSAGSIAGKLG